jgi:hypothetical protein
MGMLPRRVILGVAAVCAALATGSGRAADCTGGCYATSAQAAAAAGGTGYAVNSTGFRACGGLDIAYGNAQNLWHCWGGGGGCAAPNVWNPTGTTPGKPAGTGACEGPPPPPPCEPDGAAPVGPDPAGFPRMTWDATECRWEFVACSSEYVPGTPAGGYWSASARWFSGGCLHEPAPTSQGQEWRVVPSSSCPVEDEGEATEPPLPDCDPGQFQRPDTGQCLAACLEDQTRNASYVCEWNACPEGQSRNEGGHCVSPAPGECVSPQVYSQGLRRCVNPDPPCPRGTTRAPGGNCVADTPPASGPSETSETVTRTPGPNPGETIVTTTRTTTGPGGTTTEVQRAVVGEDGELLSLDTESSHTGAGASPSEVPINGVPFLPGDGPAGRSWAEIHADFLGRLQDLPPVAAALGLAAAFPSGSGVCPFQSVEVMGMELAFTAGCDLYESACPTISQAARALWVVVGILILLGI